MKIVMYLSSLIFFVSCSHSSTKRYEALVKPHLAASNKAKMAEVFGKPIKCTRTNASEKCELQDGKNVCITTPAHEKCEYRTTKGRNDPTAAVYRPQPGWGPDVSPYENFDVIHLYFDEQGKLESWKPIYLH